MSFISYSALSYSPRWSCRMKTSCARSWGPLNKDFSRKMNACPRSASNGSWRQPWMPAVMAYPSSITPLRTGTGTLLRRCSSPAPCCPPQVSAGRGPGGCCRCTKESIATRSLLRLCAFLIHSSLIKWVGVLPGTKLLGKNSFIIYYNSFNVLKERFETGLSTSPPFPLKHIFNLTTVQTVVFAFSAGFPTVLHIMVLFAVQGCTNGSLFDKNFGRTSGWKHGGGYLRFQPDSEGVEFVLHKKSTKYCLNSITEIRLRSAQLSIFSLKPLRFISANLHLIVGAYFGGPCYFVVTGDAAAFYHIASSLILVATMRFFLRT